MSFLHPPQIGSGSSSPCCIDSKAALTSDAEEAEFPRLSLAEQARILMADAEEDGEKSTAKGEVLRTKNEQLEETIEVQKPDIVYADIF